MGDDSVTKATNAQPNPRSEPGDGCAWSECLSCGRRHPLATRTCPECPDALLRAVYPKHRFEPREDAGIFRFLDWLPPARGTETRVGPAVYRSESLGAELGLERMYVGCNGYVPERGAFNPTGSFKDFEALPTLLFLREHGVESVVLASAGNTARAFAYAGVVLNFRVHIIVPERMLDRLWIPIEPTDAVRVTVISDSRDYYKAIQLCDLVSRTFGVTGEGGARNIARRDGMGTSVLEFARVVGEVPGHYFQAVGSGTGGIAAWEAAIRLAGDGRFAPEPPVLHLAQNDPFTPIHDAWARGRAIRPEQDVEDQIRRIDRVDAGVLANRNPPYALAGGVRDALMATRGRTYSVTNAEARAGAALFERCEGFPIGPASAVAVGALVREARAGGLDATRSVLLNMTGNDEKLVGRDYSLHRLVPGLRVSPDEVSERGMSRLEGRFLGE
jgi:cysteate synthase